MTTTNEFEEARERVAKWAGAVVEFWEYSVSHRTLVLRLHSPSRPKENLHLVCGACEWIGSPTKWTNSMLRLSLQAAGDPLRTRVVVEDAAVGARIVCGAIVADENVQPLY